MLFLIFAGYPVSPNSFYPQFSPTSNARPVVGPSSYCFFYFSNHIDRTECQQVQLRYARHPCRQGSYSHPIDHYHGSCSRTVRGCIHLPCAQRKWTQRKTRASFCGSSGAILYIVDCLLTACSRRLRVWWCPTAEFSLLPLHAAGPCRKAEKNLFDIYISSYTPTLTTLIHARQSAPPNSAAERIGQASTTCATPSSRTCPLVIRPSGTSTVRTR